MLKKSILKILGAHNLSAIVCVLWVILKGKNISGKVKIKYDLY